MRLRLRTIRILVGNDLQLSLRNWSLLMLLGLPLLVSLIMSLISSPSLGTPVKVALATGATSQFAAKYEAATVAGRRVVQIVPVKDAAQAMKMLSQGDIEAVIYLPEDIDRAIADGSATDISAVVDDRSQGAVAALGLLRQEASSASSQEERVMLSVKPLRGLTPAQIMLPTWAITVLVSGVTLMPGTLARDRREKMMAALLVAPVSFAEFVIAKAVFGIIVTAGGAVFVLLANGGLTGAPLVTLAFILIGAAVFTLLGLLISLLIENLQTAIGVSTLIYLPMLYGAFFVGVPGMAGAVTRFTPGYYVHTAILHSLNGTATWRSELPDAMALLAMGAVLLVACVWAVRKQDF